MDRSIYKTHPELASHRNHFINCMKVGNSCKLAGKYDEALKHFAQARQHAYKLLSARPLVLSRCYLFIADVYQLKGNYARAARSYEKSIRYATQDLGKHHKHVVWLAKHAKMCLRQIPDKKTYSLVGNLLQLALEIAIEEIELGGVMIAGFFAFSLLKDVFKLVDMRRKR